MTRLNYSSILQNLSPKVLHAELAGIPFPEFLSRFTGPFRGFYCRSSSKSLTEIAIKQNNLPPRFLSPLKVFLAKTRATSVVNVYCIPGILMAEREQLLLIATQKLYSGRFLREFDVVNVYSGSFLNSAINTSGRRHEHRLIWAFKFNCSSAFRPRVNSNSKAEATL